jgi:hypothetical protein
MEPCASKDDRMLFFVLYVFAVGHSAQSIQSILGGAVGLMKGYN